MPASLTEQIKQAIDNNNLTLFSSLLDEHDSLDKLVFREGYLDTQDAIIHRVIRKNSLPMLEQMFIIGANLKLINNKGDTALHIAADVNHPVLLKYLIDKQVALNGLNFAGKTPLQLAQARGFKSLERVLLEAGAVNTRLSAYNSSFVGKEINYQRNGSQFLHFAVSTDGNLLAAVEDQRSRLIVFDLPGNQSVLSIELDQPPQDLGFYRDQLIVFYEDKLQIRGGPDFRQIREIKTETKIKLFAIDEALGKIAYSDAWSTYLVELETTETQKIPAESMIKTLVFSDSGQSLFICGNFNIDIRDTENFETTGSYNTYATAFLARGEQLLLLVGKAGNSGNSFVIIDNKGDTLKTFSNRQSFQQFDATLQTFNADKFIIESFNQLVIINPEGQGYQLSFGDWKFSDFEYRAKSGFILFQADEIRLVNTNGTVTNRLLAGEHTEVLKAFNVEHQLTFTASGASIASSTKSSKHLNYDDIKVTALVSHGDYLAAGYLDGSYSIWRLPKLKLISQEKHYLSGKVSSIEIDTANQLIYLGGQGRIAMTAFSGKKSNKKIAKQQAVFRGHSGFIQAMVLSTDKSLLISSGDDQSLKFWHTKSATLIDNLQLERGWLTQLTISNESPSAELNKELDKELSKELSKLSPKLLRLVGAGPGIRAFSMELTAILAEIGDPRPEIAVQVSNTTAVGKIVLDNQALLMANLDGGSVNVRDIKTGLLQSRIFPKAGTVNDLAFTKDGRSLVLVSGSDVEYWDPATAKLQKLVDQSLVGAAYHEINSLPNFNLMLGSNKHGWHDPFLIHSNSAERVGNIDYARQKGDRSDAVLDVAVSASGNKIATYGNKSISIFELEGTRFELKLSLPRDEVDVNNSYWRNYIGFSADERYINYVSFDGANHTVIHDIIAKQEVFRRPGKLSTFLDKHRFVHMANNTALNIIDLDALLGPGQSSKPSSKSGPGQDIELKTDHIDLISTLAYNQNEGIFVSADIWGNTFTWDARSGKLIRRLERFENDIYVAEISSNGRFLSYTNKQGIHLLDFKTMSHINIDGDNYPYFGAFTPDAKRFYYRKTKDYHYIDLETLSSEFGFETPWHKKTTKGAAITADGKYLAFNQDKTSYIFELGSGKKIAAINRTGLAGDNSVLSAQLVLPGQTSIIGHNIKPAEPGTASAQLTAYNYISGKSKLLADEVIYDMSDEIERFTSEADLRLTQVSPGSRYYANSENRYLKIVDLNSGELIFRAYRNNIKHLSFDSAETVLLLADEAGYIEKLSLRERRIISRYKAIDARISSLKITGNTVMVLGDNEVINLFDLSSDELIVSVAPRGKEDFMIMDPAGYYYATKNAAQMGIAFRKGREVFPFEQFDLQFNRPDKAFGNLVIRGLTNKKLAAAYTKAYEKRVARFGLSDKQTEIDNQPNLTLARENLPISTDKQILDVTFVASGKDLNSINVWVNSVPIYGRSGQKIKSRQIEKNRFSSQLKIPLNDGKNRIQFAVRSKSGVESLRQTFDVNATIHTQAKTHLIMIGASKYQQSAKNLDYAAKDATDVASLFGDDVILHLLTNEQVTTSKIRALKQKLLNTHPDDRVVVFYAGHGMLTDNLDYYLGTFDIDFNEPEKNGLSYETLEYLFDGIPARNRLMLIDACHSGEADKTELLALNRIDTSGALSINNFAQARGFDAFEDDSANEQDSVVVESAPSNKLGLQASFDLSKQLFADIRKDTGVTVISASGSAEFAWEKDDLSNGVFTHSLLQGLKSLEADTNDDKRVTVSELQTYVRDKVLFLTGGMQQPTFRSENIDNDWVVYQLP